MFTVLIGSHDLVRSRILLVACCFVFGWRLLLVSTYVVCERLSVMHEPAGVVEILVQILQNTPILKYSFRIPPPPKWKLSEILALWLFSFRIPPPPKWNLSEILALWLFSFRIPPPPMKVVRDLGTLTFQFQNTPPPRKLKFRQILAL